MKMPVHCVRTLILIYISFFFTLQSFAQSVQGNSNIELGFGVGPMFFLGDLGGRYDIGRRFLKDLNLSTTKPAFIGYASIYPSQWLGFRFALSKGAVAGADYLIDDKGGAEHFRKIRNLEFRSGITEAQVGVEFYPTVFFENYLGLFGKFRPYGTIGVGIFHFNPQAKYFPSGNTADPSYEWVDLQPLMLEGQGMAEYPDRKQYHLTQAETIFGFGFKYYTQDNFYIGVETSIRHTNTDYIDNVSKDYIDPNLFDKYLSPKQAAIAKQLYFRGNLIDPTTRALFPAVGEQRGDPKQPDAFFSTVLRFGWRLNRLPEELKRTSCPRFY